MLQLMNTVSTPALGQPRASLHDVSASSRLKQGVASLKASSKTDSNTNSDFDPNLSVEELISRLVQDCFDKAISDDDDAPRPDVQHPDVGQDRVSPGESAMPSRSRVGGVSTQTSVDGGDSDSGVSTLSDTAPASVAGDVGVVEVDVASPCSTPGVEQPVDVMAKKVMFGGRDVLDLARNLGDPSWKLQPTLLPPMNLDMFWKNRSQYHRLGDFGAAETLKQVGCYACDFHFPVPN